MLIIAVFAMRWQWHPQPPKDAPAAPQRPQCGRQLRKNHALIGEKVKKPFCVSLELFVSEKIIKVSNKKSYLVGDKQI